jgi:hypothetical protein
MRSAALGQGGDISLPGPYPSLATSGVQLALCVGGGGGGGGGGVWDPSRRQMTGVKNELADQLGLSWRLLQPGSWGCHSET